MRYLILCILFFCFYQTIAQKNKLKTIAFYNVENLFDDKDDPLKNDEDFTPSGKYKWTDSIVQLKIANIAKVIYTIDSLELPIAIGLCEIENKNVLISLTNFIHSKYKVKYEISHFESPDERGIDVALLYQAKYLRLKKDSALIIKIDSIRNFNTRNIHYAELETQKKEIFHFFINHWPSRSNGQEKSEPRRLAAAEVLRNEIQKINPEKSNIIIMGDLNDYPNNKSVYEILHAKSCKDTLNDLCNLAWDAQYRNNIGSYIHRDEWGMLDQIIISKAIFQNKKYKAKEMYVLKKDWLLFKLNNGKILTNRCIVKNKFTGGYSDHLPVYFKIKF